MPPGVPVKLRYESKSPVPAAANPVMVSSSPARLGKPTPISSPAALRSGTVRMSLNDSGVTSISTALALRNASSSCSCVRCAAHHAASAGAVPADWAIAALHSCPRAARSTADWRSDAGSSMPVRVRASASGIRTVTASVTVSCVPAWDIGCLSWERAMMRNSTSYEMAWVSLSSLAAVVGSSWFLLPGRVFSTVSARAGSVR